MYRGTKLRFGGQRRLVGDSGIQRCEAEQELAMQGEEESISRRHSICKDLEEREGARGTERR